MKAAQRNSNSGPEIRAAGILLGFGPEITRPTPEYRHKVDIWSSRML